MRFDDYQSAALQGIPDDTDHVHDGFGTLFRAPPRAAQQDHAGLRRPAESQQSPEVGVRGHHDSPLPLRGSQDGLVGRAHEVSVAYMEDVVACVGKQRCDPAGEALLDQKASRRRAQGQRPFIHGSHGESQRLTDVLRSQLRIVVQDRWQRHPLGNHAHDRRDRDLGPRHAVSVMDRSPLERDSTIDSGYWPLAVVALGGVAGVASNEVAYPGPRGASPPVATDVGAVETILGLPEDRNN